ncbi:matrixin family metalloprotease [Streptococcus hyovaginalis]|uniref:matrixin family metalloprotease n=1 Tax=Streptococcus hyovaginalis TaxID=149015 RepID=UPI000426290C|nr:matrixin family metalloprotease [Streptococcus hyovaginalis]
MKHLFKLLLAIPRFVLSLIWNILFSLLKTVIFLAVILFGLVYYANHSSSPLANQLSNVFDNVSSYFDPNILQNPQAIGDNLTQLETDFHEHLKGAKWSTNKATIYIETQNETFRSAYLQAIDAWNQTGAFQFRLVEDPDQANIVAKDYSDSETQAAGLTNTQVNALTNHLVSVDVYLNAYYLLNPSYGYDQERIVNTAIHELGHAIGLGHDDEHDSVMQSAGSHYGIQAIDIAAVHELYQER